MRKVRGVFDVYRNIKRKNMKSLYCAVENRKQCMNNVWDIFDCSSYFGTLFETMENETL